MIGLGKSFLSLSHFNMKSELSPFSANKVSTQDPENAKI